MRTLAIICLVLAGLIKLWAFLRLADKKLDDKTRLTQYVYRSIPAYVLLIPVVLYLIMLYSQ